MTVYYRVTISSQHIAQSHTSTLSQRVQPYPTGNNLTSTPIRSLVSPSDEMATHTTSDSENILPSKANHGLSGVDNPATTVTAEVHRPMEGEVTYSKPAHVSEAENTHL